MLYSAHNLDPGINAIPEKETLASGSKRKEFLGESAASQKPDGHVIAIEPIPPAQDVSAARSVEDREALHQAPSGPPYSIFTDRQRKLTVIMVACAGFFSPLSANIYCKLSF